MLSGPTNGHSDSRGARLQRGKENHMPWRAGEGHMEGRGWGRGLSSGPQDSGCLAAAPGSLLSPPHTARRILELNPLSHCQYCLQGPTQILKSGAVGGCGHRARTKQHTLDRGGLRTQAPPGHLRSDGKQVSLSCEVGSQIKCPRDLAPHPAGLTRPLPRLGPGAKRKCLTSAQWAGGRSSGRQGPRRGPWQYQEQTGAGYTARILGSEDHLDDTDPGNFEAKSS